MSRIKLITVVGTRPELIRLSEIIKKCDSAFDHYLIHTGQNFDFELNQVFFEDLGIRKPDFFLNSNDKNYAYTIANIISKFYDILIKIKPDALLILGDTNSSLCAIPAKRENIPIFHMEAGNRCFDYRVPEEINRRIVDVISDINLTYSKIARNYLIRENFPQDQVIVSGSPMKEVISINLNKIKESKIMTKLNLDSKKFLVLSTHRQENVDNVKNLRIILESVDEISKDNKLKVVFGVHPRTKKLIDKNKIKLSNNFMLLKPFGFLDYINLQMNSLCVFSDSGTITEESNILKFKALNIREQHERPEGFEEGAVIFTGLNKRNIIQSFNFILSNNSKVKTVTDYDVLNVSEKVVKTIFSYFHFIRRKTYLK